MLDDKSPLNNPQAVAKVRLAFKAIGNDIADRVLELTGDAATAVALAPHMQQVADAAAKLDDDEEALPRIIAAALADPRSNTPRDFKAVALEMVATEWAGQGDSLKRTMIGTDVKRDFTRGPDFRAKMQEGIEALLDPRNATAMGRDAAQGGFGGIVMQIAKASGLRSSDPFEALQASMSAHSTSDFPIILDGAMGNTVARRIAQTLPAIAGLSREIPRDDYRPGRSIALSATSMPNEVREGGEIQFVSADEKGEQLPVLRDFASGFNITLRAMVNDSTALRLLDDIGNRMAQGAVERLRAVLLEPLLANSGAGQTMADGNALFTTARGNLAATAAVLNVTSLNLARVAMRRQKGLKGEILSLEPWAILVPPELEIVAEQLVATIAAAKVADVNPFTGSLQIVVEPGLTSPTAWYVCADPARADGLAHAFLSGQSAPRIESRAAWSTLGMEFRLHWPMDAKFIETASWFRNPGA